MTKNKYKLLSLLHLETRFKFIFKIIKKKRAHVNKVLDEKENKTQNDRNINHTKLCP